MVHQNQSGLDILMSFDLLKRIKVIEATSRMSGTDRAMVLKWVINGKRDTVDSALSMWIDNGAKEAQLTVLAWSATYGLGT